MKQLLPPALAKLVLTLVLVTPSAVVMAEVEERGCNYGDCVNGIGTLVDEDANGLFRYRGEFVNGKYHGFGKLELLDKKITYKGNFKIGKRSGRGIEWDSKNSVYMGQWQNDKRNGQGLQAYRVEGWKEDKYTEFWLRDNTENYQGTFRNNNFDGEGTYRWPDGVKYIGGWAASKKHGRGYFLHNTGVRSDRIFEFDERVYDEPIAR